VEGFHPQVGVLLNVTDDHLDRYRDRAHYLATKRGCSRVKARRRRH
jgi:UDP-N-acetylmuramoylalanine-D-glutamate ligase